jgi:hypothetical protein
MFSYQVADQHSCGPMTLLWVAICLTRRPSRSRGGRPEVRDRGIYSAGSGDALSPTMAPTQWAETDEESASRWSRRLRYPRRSTERATLAPRRSLLPQPYAVSAAETAPRYRPAVSVCGDEGRFCSSSPLGAAAPTVPNCLPGRANGEEGARRYPTAPACAGGSSTGAGH